MLAKNKSRITDKNKQLIHSDLGADNFIFKDDINIEKDAFYLLLLNAALYRIVGPLIDKLNRNNKDYKGLKKRFFILKEVLNLNQ
ncbi:hypothetical protein KQI38_17680 [Tissierella carlieri]|uniref:hypothetical protein n=1 Tax=Tissierella carlieri TaxID=689904 RepID=UPI001C116382|nr:hypothetical protein [Tissierella carlieri]MBU5313860.1 hypothetical protein [Tissierella carlieri]